MALVSRGRWWLRWVCAALGHHWDVGEPLSACEWCGAVSSGEHRPGW